MIIGKYLLSKKFFSEIRNKIICGVWEKMKIWEDLSHLLRSCLVTQQKMFSDWRTYFITEMQLLLCIEVDRDQNATASFLKKKKNGLASL